MTPIKYRNMGVQVLLFIITFGFYSVYWFYQTATELKQLTNDTEAAPGLWTVFLFIPLANVYAWFMYAEMFEKISSEKLNKWITLILVFVFSPAVWFLVQRDLNNAARPKTY